MKSSLSFIVFRVILAQLYLVAAYDDNSLLEDTSKVTSKLKEQLPSNLQEIFPDINVGTEMLEKRCAHFGTNDSFSELQGALQHFRNCIVKIVDYGKVKEEIEKERLTGNLDKVFRKYCKKSGEIRSCVNDFAQGMQPCLSDTEKQNMPLFTNISEALTNFICFKEGDRIALFISEGGPECLNDSYNQVIDNCGHFLATPEEIAKAMNSTEAFNSTSSDFPLLRLEKDDCENIGEFQKCVVSHLENCTEPTPANIVDSLFKYVIKSTKCKQYIVSSSLVISSNVVFIMVGLFCAFILNQIY